MAPPPDFAAISRPRTAALDTSFTVRPPAGQARAEAAAASTVRYADETRPGLVDRAKSLFDRARQSLVTTFRPEARHAAADSFQDLVQHAPSLRTQPGRLEALFSRHSAPRAEAAAPPPGQGGVERLLQTKNFQDIKQNAFDDKAFVFNKGVASEPEQMRLMKATIESADKFAAVTTYGIKPIDAKGVVTNTMHAVLAGLAQKQDDPDFNFVFLYNKSVGIQNKATGGKRTQVSLNEDNKKQDHWPQVIQGYNKQVLGEYNKAVKKGAIEGLELKTVADLGRLPKAQLQGLAQAGHISGLPITDLKAKVYLVAASPFIAGSHHNKFAINDSGFAATLGASIGNTSKPSWFDSGAVTLSQKLASSQRDYLVNTLLPEGKHIGLLTAEGGEVGVDAATSRSDVKAMRATMSETIQGIEIKPPFAGDDPTQLNAELASGLRSSGFLKPNEAVEGASSQVAWVQNTGSTIEPTNAKPIKQALEHLFKEAKPGDTLLLRNNAFNGTAQKMVAEAIGRGVNVQILAPTKTKVHEAAGLFKDIQSLKNKVDALPASQGAGKLEIHVFNPNQTLRDAHEFDPGGRPVNDHAKVYALKRLDPAEPSLLLTGSHNLDGQSFKRSHENMMFMQSTNTQLTASLFDEFWDATPEMDKKDIDLLVTEFKKPLTTSQSQWAEQLQHKDELLSKLGLSAGR
jgi:hypothetical protein